MSKPIIRIHNSETGEIVDREMTDSEFNDYEKEKAKDVANLEKQASIVSTKLALLEKLGLTDEEAKLLLS